MFPTFLIIVIAALTTLLVREKREKNKLKQRYDRYDALISREDFEQELESSIDKKQNELEKLTTDRDTLAQDIETLQNKLREVEEDAYMQSLGVYKPKYDFVRSERYQEELNEVKERQKQMIKNKVAAQCPTSWEVGGSKKKGQKMVNDFLKLVLTAFNGECNAAIAKVKYNNIDSLEKRILNTFEKINKLSATTHCYISDKYLELILSELHLVHEYQEKKYEEREEQKRIQKQMREEKRIRDEIEKARKEAEKEEKRYQKALEKARKDIGQAVGIKKEELEDKIRELEQQLSEATDNKERAISRAQMAKSGHIYVISNIGPFGENIYKIGMTRRLEPSEYVSGLNPAVPFPFDVHALIFSEDVIEMESMLQEYFDYKRINKVKADKGYYKVSLNEIEKAVKSISRDTGTVKAEISFTKIAEAEQFRKTLAIEQNME